MQVILNSNTIHRRRSMGNHGESALHAKNLSADNAAIQIGITPSEGERLVAQ